MEYLDLPSLETKAEKTKLLNFVLQQEGGRYNTTPSRGCAASRSILSGVHTQNSGLMQPRPQMTLAKFDGNIMKYGNFKRQFTKYVEDIYHDYNDRMSFSESLCSGMAQEVTAGLSCLENRRMAYKLAWSRLDKRFGNPRKLLALVKQNLLNEPAIKKWDAKALTNLCDKMHRCETSFLGWGKEELLNSEELMQSLFMRLPYKLKSQFVAVSNGGSGSGTFSDLRIVVEKGVTEADTEYGQLLKRQGCRKPVSHSTPQFRRSETPGNSRHMCTSTQSTSSVVQSKPQRIQPLICLLCRGSHVLWKCEKI